MVDQNGSVLLLLQDQESLSRFEFALASRLPVPIHPLSDSSKAIELMMDEHNVRLIVCEDSHEYFRFFKFLLSIGFKSPIILLRIDSSGVSLKDMLPDLDSIELLVPPNILDKMVEMAAEVVAIPAGASEFDGEYCRIRTELLVRATPLLTDVFLCLSPNKYVRMFREGTNFSEEDAQRYIRLKGAKYMYLKRASCQEFGRLLNSELAKILNGTTTLSDDDAIALAASVQETAIDLTEQIGVTPELQKIVHKNVSVTVKQISSHPQLGQVMDYLKRDPENYLTHHSVMLAYVSCFIAKQMDWCSEGTYENLTWASFFHDVSIRNSGVAKLQSLAEADRARNTYGSHEIQEFKNHPIKAAQLISRFKEIPQAVDSIIMQHHERPDGSGFPRGLRGLHISPLATVFIVAHDLVKYHIENGPGASLQDFLMRTAVEYNTANFKKVWQMLKSGSAKKAA